MLYFADILFFISVLVFCFGYMANKYTFSKNETCWGCNIVLESKFHFARALFPIFASLFGVALVVWIFALVESSDEFEMDFVDSFVLPTVLALAPIPIGLLFGEAWVKEAIKNSRTALCLERFPIIGAVNQYLIGNESKVAYIGIFNNGITFVDSGNSTFLIFYFNRYNMGNLSNTKQMLMLATYFVQKYPNKFNMKLVEDIQFNTSTGNSFADMAGTAVNIANAASSGNVKYIKLIKM